MVELIIGVVGLIGIPLGVYGLVLQRRAQRETAKLPEQVAKDVLATLPIGHERDEEEAEDQAPPAGAGEEETGLVGYQDVDDDGRPELLVQHLRGLHSCVLKVFGNRNGRVGEFELLGELANGVLSSYQVGDFDGDCRTEIATLDLDPDSDLPFAAGVRVEHFYRWDGRRFGLVGTGRRWDPAEDPDGTEVLDLTGMPKWALAPS